MKIKIIISILCFSLTSFMGCNDEDNLLNSKNDNPDWKEIAKIDDISSPKVYFVNENIGFIAAQVHYESMFLTGPQIYATYHDTLIIADTIIINTVPEQKYPLWKTEDGGKNWYALSNYFKSSIKDIYFLDAYTGFVVTRYEGVFKTVNQGDSWEQIFGAEIYSYHSGGINPAFPQEVCFYTKNNGFISTTRSANGNLYFISSDGGKNWHLSYSNQWGENFIFPEKDEMTGYASDYGHIYKTIDGGLNWNIIFTEMSHLSAFSFFDINNGLYYDSGKILKTTDSGNTYNMIHDLSEDKIIFDYSIDKIVYINPELCYLLHNGQILQSKDRCRTFIIMDGAEFINDMSFPSENKGYAVSQNGTFYKFVNAK